MIKKVLLIISIFVMTPKNHLEFLALELEKKYKDVT